ncbi:lysine histidine transporter-like 8 [Dorcoceras hygrometricum]|nr:lysine histidine transporter-like 8 [Dorcoceras hygrometricum]
MMTWVTRRRIAFRSLCCVAVAVVSSALLKNLLCVSVLEFAEFVDGHFFNQLRTVHVAVGSCDSYDSAAFLFCRETTNEISPRNSMLLRTRHFDLKITSGFIRQTKEDMSSDMPRKDEWLPETTHKSPSTIRHKRKKRGKQKYEGSGEEIATNRQGENKDKLGEKSVGEIGNKLRRNGEETSSIGE